MKDYFILFIVIGYQQSADFLDKKIYQTSNFHHLQPTQQYQRLILARAACSGIRLT